jgi:hypothetical protein
MQARDVSTNMICLIELNHPISEDLTPLLIFSFRSFSLFENIISNLAELDSWTITRQSNFECIYFTSNIRAPVEVYRKFYGGELDLDNLSLIGEKLGYSTPAKYHHL